jgi:hypothetical protein
MNRFTYFLILAMLLVFFSGCAEKIEVVFPANAYEYGFFSGLWHGFIAPFSLIGMFFDMDVVIFATKNTGLSYGLGFLIGSGGWGILDSNARKRKD